MKNLGIILVLILVVVGLYVSKGSKEESKMIKETEDAMIEKENAMEKEDGAMEEKEDGAMMEKSGDKMVDESDKMMKSAGTYEAYSDSKLALADSGDVVLFFRASWCPTCRALNADLKANLESIPAGVTILDVNYDNSTVLKQKYGVTYQHTLVQVDSSGTMITKWTGSPTLSALLGNIK